jgi:predicted ester cyclase
MLGEQNKSLVLQFYQAFDDRQIDQALSLLDSNFVAHLAGMSKSLDKEEFKQFGMSFYSAFSGGQHIFDEIIVSGDRVVTCGKFIATHLGEFQGLPPTGKHISLEIMHIDRIENGKLVEHWGQGDTMGLMQQLGIISLPSPKLLGLMFASRFKGFASKFFKS